MGRILRSGALIASAAGHARLAKGITGGVAAARRGYGIVGVEGIDHHAVVVSVGHEQPVIDDINRAVTGIDQFGIAVQADGVGGRGDVVGLIAALRPDDRGGRRVVARVLAEFGGRVRICLARAISSSITCAAWIARF